VKNYNEFLIVDSK